MLKSKVVTLRSPLCKAHFDFEKIISFSYIFFLKFTDLQILCDDYNKLDSYTKNHVLSLIHKTYHDLYQTNIKCCQSGLYEVLLRILFECLKGINCIKTIKTFVNDIRFSKKREKNHQKRILVLLFKLDKYFNRIKTNVKSDCITHLIFITNATYQKI